MTGFLVKNLSLEERGHELLDRGQYRLKVAVTTKEAIQQRADDHKEGVRLFHDINVQFEAR
jgi:hypothetical protein